MSIAAQTQPSYGTVLPEHKKDDATLDSGSDEHSIEDDSSSQDAPSITAGVQAIEAISQTWTGRGLFVAYLGLILLTGIQSLEQQTTVGLTPFAVSAFKEHSLVSTISVVQSILLSVVKPPMAKLSDVAGRLEAFTISVFLYTLGYVQEAACTNVQSFAGAQIFYAAGQTGLQILVQIFVADTTDLLWRAFFSSIPDMPFLWTTWVGPIITGSFAETNWRWGYGIWAICLPLSFLPLFFTLFLNQRKAKRLGYLPVSPYKGKPTIEVLKRLFYDLDFFGLLLLTAFVCLILIPLTIGAADGWNNPSIIAMFCVGGACLIAFPFWERSKKFNPRPFFPSDIFRSRTVLGGVSIAFFYFMAFYLSVFPYFSSYLQIVEGQSVTAANHITQTFSFSSTVTSIVVSIIILYTARYKYFVTFGAILYTTGIGLMIAYRKAGASVATLVGCQIAIGIGGGLVNVPAQLGVQASVTHQEVAMVTAVFLTILEIGGAVGSAISGAIWTNNVLPKLEKYLPPETRHLAADIYGDLTVSSDYIRWPSGTLTREAINRSYDETMHIILIVGVCVSALLIPLSFLMKNYKLDQIDQKVKGRVIGGQADTDGRPEVERQATDEPSSEATLGQTPKTRSRLLWRRR